MGGVDKENGVAVRGDMPRGVYPRIPGKRYGGNWTPDICNHCGVPLTAENWRVCDQRQHHKLCTPCGRQRSLDYYADNQEKRKAWQRAHYVKHLKPLYAALRAEAIAAYGSLCTCCGESRPEFLAIDHIAGGGSAERKTKEGNKAYYLYYRLKEEGWPTDGHQLLCSNCNYTKWAHGQCPHQTEPPATSFPWLIPRAA